MPLAPLETRYQRGPDLTVFVLLLGDASKRGVAGFPATPSPIRCGRRPLVADFDHGVHTLVRVRHPIPEVGEEAGHRIGARFEIDG